MAQLTVEVSQDNLFNHLHILTGKAEQRTRRIINFLTVFPVFFRQTELMHAGDVVVIRKALHAQCDCDRLYR